MKKNPLFLAVLIALIGFGGVSWGTEKAESGQIQVCVDWTSKNLMYSKYWDRCPNKTQPLTLDLKAEDGKSAFELAQDSGYVGNLNTWLNSLRGPSGPTGARGPQGPTGATGASGAQGPAGSNADMSEAWWLGSTQSQSVLGGGEYTRVLRWQEEGTEFTGQYMFFLHIQISAATEELRVASSGACRVRAFTEDGELYSATPVDTAFWRGGNPSFGSGIIGFEQRLVGQGPTSGFYADVECFSSEDVRIDAQMTVIEVRDINGSLAE